MHLFIFDVELFGKMASANRVTSLIKPLLKYDIKVFNYVSYREGDRLEIKKSTKRDTINLKQEIRVLNNSIYSLFRYYYFSSKFILKNISHENVIYIYGEPKLHHLCILLFAKILNMFIILDIIEDEGLVKKKSFKSSVYLILSRFLYSRANNFADLIIVISENLRIKSINKFKDIKIIKIPPTCDVSEFNFSDSIPIKENYLFYGGSFGLKDNIAVMLSAVDEILNTYPEFKIILSGVGSDSDMNALFHQISQLRNHNKVIYLGCVDKDKYIELLHNSYICFVLRNNTEYANSGFPIKLVECLAAGCIIVTNRISDIEEYVQNGYNGFICESDSKSDIINVLNELLDKKIDLNTIKLNAKKTALKYFDSESTSQNLYNIILNKLTPR